jgi:SAM-dependent methyltransferase
MHHYELIRPDPRLAELTADYPPGLFNDRLYRSIELSEHYGQNLAIDLLQRLGVAAQLDRWCSAAELCRMLGFVPSFEMALRWLLQRAANTGLLAVREQQGAREYQVQGPWPPLDLDRLRAIGLAIDPANAATLDLLDAAAAAYPTVARGELRGEDAIFGGGNVALWLAYFHNANPLYAVNNTVGALAAAKRLAGRLPLRILELGAGTGSASESLLLQLTEGSAPWHIECYLVTEPSPFLRRHCERHLKARFRHVPLAFLALDIDKPWDSQGAGRASFDLIYAVNTLHIARNLPYSLSEARATLAPGGWLIAGECLRPFPGQPVYIELVFQLLDSFTHASTDREYRLNPGFLTSEQWRHAFRAAGFEHVEVTPDQERIREVYDHFFVGAVCGN